MINNLSKKFGNKKVLKSQKTNLVQNVFDNVANKYDLMNDIMSFGMHRLWKNELIRLMNIQNNQKVLDIGCGTGDIGIKISKLNSSVSIFLGDLNLSMLEYGKNKKTNNKNLNWININAEKLPFKNNFFDKFIISFCLRNVTDLKKALKESYRVLKSGGEFYCMEFSKAENDFIERFYKNYKKNAIPLMGKLIAKNKNAYKYLSESIDEFPKQDVILKELNNIGYTETFYLNLLGGIVCIHKGWKI